MTLQLARPGTVFITILMMAACGGNSQGSTSEVAGTGGDANEGGSSHENAGGTASDGGSSNGLGGAGAGGSTSEQSCEVLPAAPRLTACAQPVGGWLDSEMFAPRSLSFVGTVTAVSSGVQPDGCVGSVSSDSPELQVLTVAADGADGDSGEYDIEYAVPENEVSWAVGDTIEVEYSFDGGGWSPQIISLSLSHGDGLEVYVGIGGTPADLENAPFTFEEGAARCVEHDTCGDWSAYDLEVASSSGTTILRYGETIALNGYQVTSGGVQEQLPSSRGGCPDWYVAFASVSMLREAP